MALAACTAVQFGLAEAQSIEGFHDPENAFVSKPDGSLVPARELGLQLPVTISGKERGGQYLFEGPGGAPIGCLFRR